MYNALDNIMPLVPETLKSCNVKSPKIDEIMTPRQKQISMEDMIRIMIKNIQNPSEEFKRPKEITFYIIVEMGANVLIYQEYLIYDTLSLIGTVGGTLGLFVGFSFYYFVIHIIDFFAEKCKSCQQHGNEKKSIPKELNHHPTEETSNQKPNGAKSN